MSLRQRLIARGLLDEAGRLTEAGNRYVAELIDQLRQGRAKAAREEVGQ